MSKVLTVTRLCKRGENVCARQKQGFRLALLGASLCVLSVRAEVVELFYDSFETPDVATASNSAVPPGWVKQHAYSGMWDVDWNTSWVMTAYGRQGIKCWWDGAIQGGFYTTNITATLQPGATYTLTFNVGNTHTETGIPKSGHSYKAYILAGTNEIASVTGTTSTDDLTSTNAVSVTTTAGNPYLGQTLRIKLINNDSSWSYQALFDNVRLVVDESAEFKRTLYFGK